MRQGHSDIGQSVDVRNVSVKGKSTLNDDFVLEKSIFNNVFEKDIRRIYIYKKAERLAKALQLIDPAFVSSPALQARLTSIGIGLVDAAILPTESARTALARELLALSSVLAIARTGGLLSEMNADLISHEAHVLLQEVAEYEEPRLMLEETPSLAHLAKDIVRHDTQVATKHQSSPTAVRATPRHETRIKDNPDIKDNRQTTGRRDTILSVIKNKPAASIKDISAHIRDVSEKTIQRELLALIALGLVVKEGERRWSTYTLAP